MTRTRTIRMYVPVGDTIRDATEFMRPSVGSFPPPRYDQQLGRTKRKDTDGRPLFPELYDRGPGGIAMVAEDWWKRL